MSLTLTLTGTGGAQGVPAWGCECAACARARRSPQYRRQPCSGVVKFNDAITLIDAGLHDLADRWSPGSFQQFLLTHYHMDHVQGLFPLRWGVGDRPAACGDLQTGSGGRHIVCADRRSLHAASRRRANLHSLAHGQGYKRH